MIIFVGDKPSPRMKPGAKPFEGAACEKRLKEWINYLIYDSEFDALLAEEKYYIINAVDIPSPYLLLGDIEFVALGNAASKWCGKKSHFKLPHPSGRNRQINDKEFIAKKLKECKEWLNSK